MVLVKKMATVSFFLFLVKLARKMFHDILQRKTSFKDIKNSNLKQSKNWDFSKGVSPWF